MIRNMCLCEGRHQVPAVVDGAIFKKTLNPLEVEEMEKSAAAVLSGTEKLNLYVTGLTVALVAVINACRKLGIDLTLYHYNRDNGGYYPQKVAV